VAPAVHDMGAKKEGFSMLRENFLSGQFEAREEVIRKAERKKFEKEVRKGN
jgi:hypothetical protein